MSSGTLICFLFITLLVKVCSAGEYCTVTCTSSTTYCEHGCCGDTCCPNITAIVVGTVLGTVIVGIAFGAFAICLYQRRRSRYTTLATIYTQTNPDDIYNQGKEDKKPPPPQPQPPPTNFADILNPKNDSSKNDRKLSVVSSDVP